MICNYAYLFRYIIYVYLILSKGYKFNSCEHLAKYLVIFVESTALPSLAAKNKKSAELWRELSNEQKSIYKEKAAAASIETTGVNVKHECRKIYSLLRDVVS